MKLRILATATVAAFACCTQSAVMAQGYNTSVVHFENRAWTDGTYRYASPEHVVVTGVVVRVNEDTGRLAVRSDSNRRYNVDTYNAEVITPSAASSYSSDDLVTGARVRVVGYRYGVGLIDADRVVVMRQEVEPAREPIAVTPALPPVVVAPPVHVDPTPVHADMIRLEGVIKLVAPDSNSITVAGDDDDQLYDIKAGDADILLPDVDRTGTIADLGTGMRVRIVGEKGDSGTVYADRIRVIRDEPVAPIVVPVHPPITDLSSYTGILIDCRGLDGITRSPSPALYGPDMSLLYPDRSHVPTPDEVQDESIVRYYRTMDAATAGVGGSHPLVLEGIEVEGPAHDGVMLTAADAALFKALDARLGYMHTWKVGYLIPADR